MHDTRTRSGARAIRQPGRGKLIQFPDYPKLIQKQARARAYVLLGSVALRRERARRTARRRGGFA